MPVDFFRKERPEVFQARFTVPSAAQSYYGLQSNTIFQAKNYAGRKQFAVKVGGVTRKVVISVLDNRILIHSQPDDAKPHINLSMSEANMHETLTLLSSAERPNSLMYQVAKYLCEAHTKRSTESPFISGCVVNNFAQNSSYDGYKLHLVLSMRQPFQNPFASGLEKEYFLIGRVLDTDCELIKFLGRKDEKCNKLVNFFGSRISRPSRS